MSEDRLYVVSVAIVVSAPNRDVAVQCVQESLARHEQVAIGDAIPLIRLSEPA